LLARIQFIVDGLVEYANILGSENVVDETDCALSSRLGHAKILGWARFRAIADGPRSRDQTAFEVDVDNV